MLENVQNQHVVVNNNSTIAKSSFLSHLKVLYLLLNGVDLNSYYRLFASIYGFVGRFADLVLVNSTYTKSNLDVIWKIPTSMSLSYECIQ